MHFAQSFISVNQRHFFHLNGFVNRDGGKLEPNWGGLLMIEPFDKILNVNMFPQFPANE